MARSQPSLARLITNLETLSQQFPEELSLPSLRERPARVHGHAYRFFLVLPLYSAEGQPVFTDDHLGQIKHGEFGHVVNVPDVAKTREKTGLYQVRFAQLLGVSVRTLQDWEQGRRAPSSAARTLFMIATKNPQALLDVA